MSNLLADTAYPMPTNIGLLTNQDILFGSPIPAIERLKIFSPEQFEDMVREWVTGYLMKAEIYTECKKCSGAGDMGRDVIAIVNKYTWDNFQCKHYNGPLSPSEINSELGKLVYYSSIGAFTLPRKYYFVSPKGAGPKFNKLLENSDDLKKQLIENWDKHCKAEIRTNVEIPLTDDLLEHINSIDFSIFTSYDPQLLIDQHAKTIYYAARFGGGLKKRRQIPNTVPAVIGLTESIYTEQLFAAYSDHTKSTISDLTHLSKYSELEGHFNRQRLGYYSADSLSQFSRDTLPTDTDYFEDLKNEFFTGVIDVAEGDYRSGYERVKATTNFAKSLQIDANPLVSQLRVDDRVGICHHLANEKRLKWTVGK